MSRARRILVFSASFGGGYAGAAAALAHHIERNHAGTVDVRVVDLFEEFLPGVNVRAKFAHQQSSAFFPSGAGTFSELMERHPDNVVLQELSDGAQDAIAAYMDSFDSDVVISTYPVAGGIVSEAARAKGCLSCTVITDYSVAETWIDPHEDLYFVSCNEVREAMVLLGVPWDRIIVSGVPVIPVPDDLESTQEARRRLGLADRFTALLTSTVGGVSEIKEVARQLTASGVQVVAVAPEGQRLWRHLKEIQERSKLLHLFVSEAETTTMAVIADVCVTRAGSGTSVPEALASGLPLVILGPVPRQEAASVDLVVNFGAALLARDEDDGVAKVRFLSTHQHRLDQMATDARLLGRAKAAHTVCERVLAALREC